jgi:hypothetical protein
VLGHARSGDAVFTTCLRLFRNYPMAVRRHYAEHRYGSMVLMNRDAGTTRFFVLIMEWEDLFVLRHWDRRDGARAEIGPYAPVPGDARRVIEASVPVPRDGALLGWLSGYQVQAVLAAHGRLPEPWEDASVVPGVLAMPRVGSQPAEWPPLTASPLDNGRLWGDMEQGKLADLGPLVTGQPGCVFWVPGGDGATGQRRTGARVVVTERLSTDEFWLPAGVYADHWMLREGTPAMTASQLLALPGVVDLAGGRGHRHLLGA